MNFPSFEAPSPEHLADLLPQYDIDSFIAKGGMGAVYKGQQSALEREVAIKVLPKEIGENQEFRESFATEAKAMARLNHPNLIGVFDFGDVEGMPYIVMEYVDGSSLYEAAWNEEIDRHQAVTITKAICDGLAHAHDHDIAHRDIKPANILLTAKGEPKIGDFGLAHAADSDQPGLVMGTPGYTAPEVFEDPNQAGPLADIYSVGVILHQLLTGIDPTESQQPPAQPSGNLRLDAIWRKATHHNPAQRYQNVSEMATDLENCSSGLRRGTPAIKRASTADAAPTAKRKPVIGPAPTAKRTPVIGAAPATKQTTVLKAAPAAQKTPAISPAPQATPSPVSPTPAPSGGNPIITKVIIIIGLIGAIILVHKAIEAKKESMAKEEAREELEKKERDRRAEIERQKLAERKARLTAREKQREASRNPKSKKEAPLESLARLRSQLASGNRIEMPVGSIRHGDRDLFLVEKNLPWHKAATFAEEHGGHLAILSSSRDIAKLNQLTPSNFSIWLGAGRAPDGQWRHVDGSPWIFGKKPSGDEAFATLDHAGFLRSQDPTERLPFIIEWHRDGSNPATLTATLERTGETLNSPDPKFPLGTVSQEERHFAVIRREVDRREAARLARLAKGHLAVPATQSESEWLESHVADLNTPDGLWLGGQRGEDLWKWDTSEPWEFANWSDDAGGSGSAMVLVPSRGWRGASPDTPASGFIIEWSDDAENRKAKIDDKPSTDLGSSELRDKARELIKQAIKDREKKLADNVFKFNWDLKVWFRTLKLSDQEKWEPNIEAFKETVKDDRIPSPEEFTEYNNERFNNDETRIEVSDQMSKIHTYCYGKQVEADEAYAQQIKAIRDAYATRLKKLADAAREKGQKAQADKLLEAAKAAEDLDAWVEQMTR